MIRVGAFCGRYDVPERGLPPGCLFATRMIGALLQRWCQETAWQLEASLVCVRMWVDDSTGWGRQRGTVKKLVRQGCESMFRIEQDSGVEVNRVKSGLVASNRELGELLEQEAISLELKVLEDLKDLGVVQGRSEAATAAAGQRWHESCIRFGRLERVPLPCQRRGIMGSASCVTVGAYGCAARPVEKETILSMRRWGIHAYHKGSSAVAPRLFFHIGAVPLRADPLVQIAYKVFNAGAALAQGAHGIERLKAVWQTGKKCKGPVHGMSQMMEHLSIEGDLDTW